MKVGICIWKLAILASAAAITPFGNFLRKV